MPGQPTEAELAADPLRHRFILVFDREGYSPDLFQRLKDQRIAILSYHKHPGPDWAVDEFQPTVVTLQNGDRDTLALAERGTRLNNGLWVRELRRRDPSGHQTSILSTAYRCALDRTAAAMFARWYQENYFKYMRQHYGLDRLIEHGISPLPETTRLVNPAWRALDSAVRRTAAELSRARARFAGHVLEPAASTPAAAAQHEARKGAQLEQIQAQEARLTDLKTQRQSQPRHVELKDLPPEQRVAQLRTGRKQFLDTIKLIAYRAESALVAILREKMSRHDDARSLVRALFATPINLRPDATGTELRIELHGQANPAHDALIEHLCTELNSTETCYPGTTLRLYFTTLRSSTFPRGQDV